MGHTENLKKKKKCMFVKTHQPNGNWSQCNDISSNVTEYDRKSSFRKY